jgi:hypothetical protein
MLAAKTAAAKTAAAKTRTPPEGGVFVLLLRTNGHAAGLNPYWLR